MLSLPSILRRPVSTASKNGAAVYQTIAALKLPERIFSMSSGVSMSAIFAAGNDSSPRGPTFFIFAGDNMGMFVGGA